MRPIFKMPGGKYYLKDWIIEQLPWNHVNMTWLEPFCGGCSITLNKPQSVKEILNDLNFGTYAVLDALQCYPDSFLQTLKSLEYKESTFLRYLNPNVQDNFDIPVKEYVLRRMSRGGMKQTFAWSERTRGGKPGDVNAWETALIEDYPSWVTRLQNVSLGNTDALRLITRHDGPNTLIYCDPPYLHETRVSKDLYGAYEMSEKGHIDLCETLTRCKSKVLISGYDSHIYNTLFRSWNKTTKDVANHQSEAATKQRRTEVLWKNY